MDSKSVQKKQEESTFFEGRFDLVERYVDNVVLTGIVKINGRDFKARMVRKVNQETGRAHYVLESVSPAQSYIQEAKNNEITSETTNKEETADKDVSTSDPTVKKVSRRQKTKKPSKG